MSDRTKELILKTLMVIEMILMCSLFPGGILLGMLIPNEETVIFVSHIIIFAFFGVGILFVILLLIFGGLKQKPVNAEKVPLAFASYQEFLDFLHGRLLENEYKMQKNVPIPLNGEVTLYLKKSKLWTLECFTIIRVPELLDEIIGNVDESVANILDEYYDYETIRDSINMTFVFCVDRITPTFLRIVNGNVQQGLKIGRLPVGVSFGDKNIYIAKQKDGFAIMKYKQLRRKFINIMDLQNIKK